MGIMKTWVDASYAVHGDMKSHTGGVVSFGTGATMSKSSKQKLNTKSSTEAELVGASDYLPYPIWAKKFLEAQGYGLTENIFYQDNQSTIRFEKNGRKSSGPNTRHVDIRYFFIKDRLNIEGIDVQYCPTEQMLADFFTKPLQGSLFRKFRDVIMGHKHIDSLKEVTTTPSQERVGQSDMTEIVWNGDDGRKTDQITQGPVSNTYADIVRKGRNVLNKISGLKVRGARAPLTFRK
jgi:KUP system potassium uptake protein